MYPRYRPRRRLALALAGVALLVLAGTAAGLVIQTALTGKPEDNFSPPAPIPVPAGPAGSPAQHVPAGPRPAPMLLVQGRDLVDGVSVGFPHSVQGAVSAAVEYLTQIGSTLDPGRAAAVARLAAAPSFSSAPAQVAQGTVAARLRAGLTASGVVPAGVSVVLTPVQYQLPDDSPDQVTVLLLGDYAQTLAGGLPRVSVGVWPVRVAWAAGDWKLLPDQVGSGYSALLALPGSAVAAAKGWRDLRPAGATG